MNASAAVPLWEAAARTGIDVDVVLDLVLAGRIPSVRRPNGRPLVDPKDVAEAVAPVSGSDPSR